jgi:hypothetical protein
MLPVKDHVSEIDGRGTQNIRALKATSSSTTDLRIYRELS